MHSNSKAWVEKTNPWGLTVAQVQAMEAVNRAGCNKGAARLLGLSHKTVEHHVAAARDRIGEEKRLLALLEFDRWQQADSERRELTSPP